MPESPAAAAKHLRVAQRTLLAVSAAAACALATTIGVASELRWTPEVKAVEGARPSVVNIHGQKTVSASETSASFDEPRKVNGMGTGVIIDERGYIITNFHVVDGVRKIEVTMADGETYIAKLISHDPGTDLAIIKIESPEKLPVIHIGTSSDLMPAEPVIAVGNAYGYKHTATRGIVSALHRSVQVSETQEYDDLIQTDASINPGNSGGPLLNIDGEMIGINVAVRAGAQGIGFAIPVDKAMKIAAQLLNIQRIDSNWHGVSSKDAESGKGLVVKEIETGSPAADAGLQNGDVITAVGPETVARPLDFERALLGRKAGEKFELTVQRGQKPVTLEFKLASAPAKRTKTPATTADASWDVLGMKLSPISPEDFNRYQSRYRGGLTVTAVRPDGPAAKQGIRRGDVLVGMHVWETITLENVAYILGRADFAALEPVKFYILRGNETLFGHLNVSLQR